MKTFFSILCMLSILVLLSACDNGDSGGSSGGSGDYPQVSFLKNTVGGEERVTCYGADNYSLTTSQTCTWNCAYYKTSWPQYVELVFDEALICNPTGEVDAAGDPIEECITELALVGQKLAACKI